MLKMSKIEEDAIHPFTHSILFVRFEKMCGVQRSQQLRTKLKIRDRNVFKLCYLYNQRHNIITMLVFKTEIFTNVWFFSGDTPRLQRVCRVFIIGEFLRGRGGRGCGGRRWGSGGGRGARDARRRRDIRARQLRAASTLLLFRERRE